MVGRHGAKPAGLLRVAGDGVTAVGYESRGTAIRLEAALFERYPREAGLQRVIDLRALPGEPGAPGRETFTRSAEALLRTHSTKRAGSHDRVPGLPLEIVPENDPYALAKGEPLRLRVLYRGAPVDGVRIAARQSGRREAAATRTDADGHARLALRTDGAWITTAVHMTRAATDESCDWKSWWASLTFDNGTTRDAVGESVSTRSDARPAR